MKKMLLYTHTFEEIVYLTYNYKTSQAAHQRLEKIVMRECKRVTTNINYGLKILPDTVLHIANSKEFHWLLQPELKAIKDGLNFQEKEVSEKYEDENGEEHDEKIIQKGYFDAQGQLKGPAIIINNDGAI